MRVSAGFSQLFASYGQLAHYFDVCYGQTQHHLQVMRVR